MALNIDVDFDEQGKKWDVDLAGELDVYTAAQLKVELTTAIENNPANMYINLQNLDYIDSTGLGVLIGKVKKLKPQGYDVFICNPKANVKKIFNITGLDKIFSMEG